MLVSGDRSRLITAKGLQDTLLNKRSKQQQNMDNVTLFVLKQTQNNATCRLCAYACMCDILKHTEVGKTSSKLKRIILIPGEQRKILTLFYHFYKEKVNLTHKKNRFKCQKTFFLSTGKVRNLGGSLSHLLPLRCAPFFSLKSHWRR